MENDDMYNAFDFDDDRILAALMFIKMREKILRPAFRKIALTYSVSTENFYDTVHEMEFSLDDMIDVIRGVYSRDEERLRSDRHLNKILDQVSTQKRRKKKGKNKRQYVRLKQSKSEMGFGTPSSDLHRSTVFDKKLSEAMVLTFKSVSGILDDESFASIIPHNHLRSMGIDESESRPTKRGNRSKRRIKRAISPKSFGDVSPNKVRNGYAFPEYATLCCLYAAIHGPAIKKLNSPVETENQLKRAKPRMNKIREVLFSEEYHRAITRTVFDLLASTFEDDYKALSISHCSTFWLDPQKKGLKTLKYALENHTMDSPNRDALNSVEAVARFCEELKRLVLTNYTFGVICPIAESIVIGAVPTGLVLDLEGYISLQDYLLETPVIDSVTKDHIRRQDKSSYYVDACDYLVAEIVGKVVTTFVEATKRSVVMLLECLPDAAVAGENELWDYFNKL